LALISKVLLRKTERKKENRSEKTIFASWDPSKESSKNPDNILKAHKKEIH
jgi:hypothetical protein